MDNFLLTLIQLTLPQEAKVITSIKVSSILDVSGTLKISHTKCDYFNVLLVPDTYERARLCKPWMKYGIQFFQAKRWTVRSMKKKNATKLRFLFFALLFK